MKLNTLKLASLALCLGLSTFLFANENAAVHEGNHFDYKSQQQWKFVSGDHQSPINIETNKTSVMEDRGRLFLDYPDVATYDQDNGHSIEVGHSGDSIINGRKFHLAQFHFHAPSEHTVNGKNYPVEVHFVNKAQDGRIAVIGVFMKEGKENKGFNDVLNQISKVKDVEKKEILIDVDALLPKNLSYYHYLGSLTTPPLIENVEWYVLQNPIEVSKEQIEKFKKYYDGNNRNIQPLGDRSVLSHNE
ncbi:MAG: carbonic anhydrase [Campylobacteraceae bacterium]